MNRYEMNAQTGNITVKSCKARASRRAAPTCSACGSTRPRARGSDICAPCLRDLAMDRHIQETDHLWK
jgi:ribosomal protein S14